MKKLTPVLMVEDVNATIEFYKDILGFRCTLTVPETGSFVFALLQSGNVQIMVQQKTSLAKELPYLERYNTIGGSFTLYIEVDNAPQLYNDLKDKIKVIKELHKTFYNTQEFYVVDCNGYVLTFASPVAT